MAMHSLVDTHVPGILVSIKNFSYDIQTSSKMIESWPEIGIERTK